MDIRDGWPTTAMRDAPEAQGYEEALSYVYNEDKRILLEEPSVFLSARRNQELYLWLLCFLPATWGQLLRALRVSSKTLRDTLRSPEGQ